MKTRLLFTGLLITALGFAQDPVVLNADFNIIPKSSGTDCACSGWINKDLGDQGESSSFNGDTSFAIKFDNDESDVMYQEIEVLPNTDYKFTYSYRVSGGEDGTSEIEIRILRGSGYIDGYTPTYYAAPELAPQRDFGYETIAQVETSANNIVTVVQEYPGDDEYYEEEFTFNSGSETSIVIFARGISNPPVFSSDPDYEWDFLSGDEETRLDFVSLINQTALSTNDISLETVSFSPNPANDFINVSSTVEQIENIKIFDLLGKMVLETKLKNNQINVSELSQGIYLLKASTTSNKSLTKKIVIN